MILYMSDHVGLTFKPHIWESSYSKPNAPGLVHMRILVTILTMLDHFTCTATIQKQNTVKDVVQSSWQSRK